MTYENLATLGVRFGAAVLLFAQLAKVVTVVLVLGTGATVSGPVFSSTIAYLAIAVLAFRFSGPIGSRLARGL